MIRHISLTALLFVMITENTAAMAQPGATACAPRDSVISKLENSYGESRMGVGLRGQSSLLEVWASSKSGTWTILVTNAEGISCVMASGESWLDMPETQAALGAPA